MLFRDIPSIQVGTTVDSSRQHGGLFGVRSTAQIVYNSEYGGGRVRLERKPTSNGCTAATCGMRHTVDLVPSGWA